MRSVNKVILVGNLTRDPELRQTPNGQNVATFGLATNREWATRDGARKSSAEFHECVAWARLAEICSQHLKKGQLVYVEGYLKTRSWDSLDGVRKFKTEIVVKDMIRLEKRNKDDNDYNDYIPEEEETAFGGYEEDFGSSQVADETPADDNTQVADETPAADSFQIADLQPEDQPKEDPINRDLGL